MAPELLGLEEGQEEPGMMGTATLSMLLNVGRNLHPWALQTGINQCGNLESPEGSEG